MGLRTYDSGQVVITVGSHVVTGYNDGDFVQVEEQGDGIQASIGANGEMARSMSQVRSVKITLTLQQTSPTNDVLSALANVDRRTGAGTFAFSMADLMGSTVVEDSNSFILKKPNSGFGTGISTREWVIQTSNDVDYNVGGN
jgi:hypothetical protein